MLGLQSLLLDEHETPTVEFLVESDILAICDELVSMKDWLENNAHVRWPDTPVGDARTHRIQESSSDSVCSGCGKPWMNWQGPSSDTACAVCGMCPRCYLSNDCNGQAQHKASPISHISASSNPESVENLLDGSAETSWVSDGARDEHWIQLHMLPGSIIKRLVLSAPFKDSFAPSNIVMLAGQTLDTLQMINRVDCRTSRSEGDQVVLLENMKNSYAIVHIRIHAVGINCRLQGIHVQAAQPNLVGSGAVQVCQNAMTFADSLFLQSSSGAMQLSTAVLDLVSLHMHHLVSVTSTHDQRRLLGLVQAVATSQHWKARFCSRPWLSLLLELLSCRALPLTNRVQVARVLQLILPNHPLPSESNGLCAASTVNSLFAALAQALQPSSSASAFSPSSTRASSSLSLVRQRDSFVTPLVKLLRTLSASRLVLSGS